MSRIEELVGGARVNYRGKISEHDALAIAKEANFHGEIRGQQAPSDLLALLRSVGDVASMAPQQLGSMNQIMGHVVAAGGIGAADRQRNDTSVQSDKYTYEVEYGKAVAKESLERERADRERVYEAEQAQTELLREKTGLQKVVGELQRANAQLQDNNDALREELDDARKERAAFGTARDTIKGQNGTIRKLEAHIDGLGQENRRLQGLVGVPASPEDDETVTSLTDQVTSLGDELDEFAEKNDKLAKELAATKEALAQAMSGGGAAKPKAKAKPTKKPVKAAKPQQTYVVDLGDDVSSPQKDVLKALKITAQSVTKKGSTMKIVVSPPLTTLELSKVKTVARRNGWKLTPHK
jgi:hypothetical protein